MADNLLCLSLSRRKTFKIQSKLNIKFQESSVLYSLSTVRLLKAFMFRAGTLHPISPESVAWTSESLHFKQIYHFQVTTYLDEFTQRLA